MPPLGEITQLTEEIPVWLALLFAIGTTLSFLGLGEGLQRWAVRKMPSGRVGSDLAKEIRELRISSEDQTDKLIEVIQNEHGKTRAAVRESNEAAAQRLSDAETRLSMLRRNGG